MFFKTLSLTLLLSMTACSWWGGTSNKIKTLMFDDEQVLGKSSDCVDNVGTFFADYFKGESEKRDVVENISCIKDITSKIFEHAIERNIKRGFSRKEIKTVLNTVFPFRDKIPLHKNVDLLFMFKKMFVGGDADGFSRSDKVSFDKALDSVQEEMLLSKDSIKHIFFAGGATLSLREASYLQLKESFERVDQVRAVYSGGASEVELSKILDHIFSKTGSLYMFKDVASSAQKILMGEGSVFINAEPELFSRAISILEIQSRIRAIDFSEGFLVGESYYDLRNAFSIASKKLKNWSAQDEDYVVSVEDVKLLVERLHALGVLKRLFSSPQMINKSLEQFLVKIFKTESFNKDSFEKLETIVRDWSRRQNRIISGFDFPWASGRVDGLTKDSALILDEIKSFKAPQFVYLVGRPIRIRRDNDKLSTQEEYFDLSLKHSLYTVVYEVFSAYSFEGYNPEKVNTEKSTQDYVNIRELDLNLGDESEEVSEEEEQEFNLNLSEVKLVFDDLRPLAVEMGFANPHACNAENRSFIEADSLTINGNGDDLLSINEAVEWIGTMISVGSISGHMMSQVENSCAYGGMKNLGSSFVSRACIQEELFSKKRLLFNYFPNAFSYIETLESDSKRATFQKNLSSAGSFLLGIELGEEGSYNQFFTESSNTCGQADFPLGRGELNIAVAIGVYIENVFFQFDKTGQRSFTNNAWTVDPDGPDEILDGNEISNFIKAKLTAPMRNYNKTLAEKYPVLGGQVDQLFTLPTRLREKTLKLDRVGTHQFIEKATGWFVKADPHPFAKKYCEDVYTTFETGVVYSVEDRLTCVPSEID